MKYSYVKSVLMNPRQKIKERKLNIGHRQVKVCVNAFRIKGGSLMSLRSKLEIESFGMFSAFAFYAAAGISCLAILAMVDFRLVHIGIIGVLNLMVAYGLLKSRVWTIWVVIALFFIATTFSVSMLYFAFWENMLQDAILIVYLFLTWVFTVYTGARRKALES